MRELSDKECDVIIDEARDGCNDGFVRLSYVYVRAGYAAGYRAAQAAKPPREPTLGMVSRGARTCWDQGGEITVSNVWRAMHDAWTQEQTSGPGVPCESPRSEVSATTSAADGNVGTEDATSGAGRIGRTAPGPLDPQNGVQRDAASPGCALGASSLESGNAREATCLNGEHDARRGSPTQQEQLGTNAGSIPATPTDPIADLCARLRDEASQYTDHTDLWAEAADALERLAREKDDVRAMLQNTNRDAARLASLVDKYKWQVRDTCTRAERAEAERDNARHSEQHTMAVLRSAERDYLNRIAEMQGTISLMEAERDALRECVRAADAMRGQG